MIANLQRVAGTDHPWAQKWTATAYSARSERLGLILQEVTNETCDAQKAAAMANAAVTRARKSQRGKQQGALGSAQSIAPRLSHQPSIGLGKGWQPKKAAIGAQR